MSENILRLDTSNNNNSSNGVSSKPTIFSWGRIDFGGLLKPRSSDVDEESYKRDGIFAFSDTRKTIVAISSNIYHTAAVTSTGEIYTSGQNTDGQVSDDASVEEFHRPHMLESLAHQRISSVSCGLTHTVCVTASGCALSFGGNESAQLGHSYLSSHKISKVPPKTVNFSFSSIPRAVKSPIIITKAACGDLFTLFLTTTGELFACGSPNYLGNPIHKDSNLVSQAERVESLVGSNIVDIAAGSSHSLAVTSSGELYGWGANSHCELGYPLVDDNDGKQGMSESFTDSNYHVQTPVKIFLPSEIGMIQGISCGHAHSVLWTDQGFLLGAGSNKLGQLALPVPRVESFEVISLPHFCLMAAAGLNHTLVLCGDTNSALKRSFSDASMDVVSPDLRSSGSGKQSAPSLSADSQSNVKHQSLSDIVRYRKYGGEAVGEHLPTRVFGFGSNSFNQISTTSTASLFRSPVEIEELSRAWQVHHVLYISAGGDHSFAIGIRGSSDANLVGADLMPSLTGPVPGGLLQKQFSTVASKATLPMDAEPLLKLIQKAENLDESDPRMLGITLSTVCEIFSSPSLLAGSFNPSAHTKEDSSSIQYKKKSGIVIDYEGLEQCYVALMQLGSNAIARLLGAIQQAITELERASTSIGSNLPDSTLKVLLVLWQAPMMSNPLMTSDLFHRLVLLVRPHAKLLVKSIPQCPQHILVSRLLKPVQEHLTYRINSESGGLPQDAPIYCQLLSLFFEANDQIEPPIAPESFYNAGLSGLPEETLVNDFIAWKRVFYQAKENPAATDFQRIPPASQMPQMMPGQPQGLGFHGGSVGSVSKEAFFVSQFPYLISAETKRRLLLLESSIQQQVAQNQAATYGMISGSGFFQPFFVLPVEREHLLQQALLHISNASELDFKKPLKVIFIGEEGVDEGGVRKEFFQLLVVQLFDLQYGMFKPAPTGRAVWINQNNTWSDEEYKLVGTLLGLALYNGVLLDIHFPKVFYKKLLKFGLEMNDLADYDPPLLQGLRSLLEYSPMEDVEHVFCRNFTVEWDDFGVQREKELIENGKNIPVTGNNRELFAKKMVNWILEVSIESQFNALYEGFCRVVHPSSIVLLTASELELLMVGTPHLDFKQLEKFTEYIGEEDWNKDHPIIRAFWEVLHAMPFEQKQKFLLFVTGSSKAPLGGLQNVGLKIQRMGPDSASLPTTHTCFNTLLLPEYSSKEKLQDRLEKAINECHGFGLM